MGGATGRTWQGGGVPGNRTGASLSYFTAGGETVLFGGWNQTYGYFSDTWTFKDGNWNETGITGPAGRRYAGMADYPLDNEVVLFGGDCNTVRCGDTWTLHVMGGTGGAPQLLYWVPITSIAGTSPSARFGAAMAWSSSFGQIELMGGWSNASGFLPDTFRFTGASGTQGTWSNITASAGLIAGRRFAQIADDPADNEIVLYGGVTPSAPLVDTQAMLGGLGAWTLQSPTSRPSARDSAGFVWDPVDKVDLLFGGDVSGSGIVNWTWTWAGGQWTDVSNTSGIAYSPRENFAFAYDMADSEVVLYGGASPLGISAETWGYVAHAWAPLREPTLAVALSATPPSRYSAMMAFDAKDGWVFLYGGTSSSGGVPLQDMWSWGPTAGWQKVCSACMPRARYGGSLVWANLTSSGADPLYLFGGTIGHLIYLNDLYAFTITSATTGTWSNLTLSVGGTTPPARDDFGMDWDEASGLVEVVDGSNTAGQLNDAYAYSPYRNTWFTLASPGMALFQVQFAWDGTASMLFGGNAGSSSTSVQETLSVPSPASAVWTKLTPVSYPSARAGGIFVWDSHFNDMVDFGDGQMDPYPDNTWGYNLSSASWVDYTNVSGARPDDGTGAAAGVYDSTYGFTMVVGEFASPQVYPGSSWIYGPSLSQTLTLPTSLDSGSTLSASMSAYGGSSGYQYSWHGLPSPCAPTLATVSCTPASVASNTTYPIRTDILDMASDVASKTTYLQVHPALTISSPTIAPSSTVESGSPITLAAVPSQGDGTYSFTWNSLPPGCASANTRILTCTPSVASNSTYSTITVTVKDGLGTSYTSSVAPMLTVVGPVAITPISETPTGGVVDSGQAASFSVTATMGSGSYSYGWTGLPTGCTSADLRTIGCSPTTASTNQSYYALQAKVTDTFSGVASSPLARFRVDIGPTIGALTQSAPAVETGQSLTLISHPSGGNGNYTFAWTNLPTGCTSSNTPVLVCSPSVPANQTFSFVTVTMTDGLGATSATSTSVTVDAAVGVSAVTVASSPIDSGQSVTFSASASGGSGSYSYTWLNLPPNGCTSANSRLLTCNPTVLSNLTFSTIQVRVTDSYGLSITSTAASLTVHVSPSASAISANPASAIDSGQTVVLTVVATGGDGVYAFTWNNLPSGCTTSNTPRLSCTPSLGANFTYTTISVTVTDGLSAQATGTLASYTVYVDPSVSSISATPGPTLESGQSVTLAVSPSGGSGSYSYTWNGLPSGCTSSNTRILSCTPGLSANGSASVTLTLTDSLLKTATTSSLSLTLFGLLTVGAISATPATSIDSGQTVHFSVTATVGQGSYSYAWSGLPSGCTTSNVRVLSCTPTVPANTTSPNVQVTVTDGANVAVSSTTLSYRVDQALGATAVTASPGGTVDSGTVVVFATTPSGGDGSYTYTWSGLPAPCATADVRSLSCTPSVALNGSYTVGVTVQDGNSATVAPGSVSLNVDVALTGSVSASPWAIDVGQSATFQASFLGGSAGYHFSWTGLPSPCATVNSPTLTCSPSVAGTSTVTVQATDSLGTSVSATISYTVVGALVAGAASASRLAMDLGGTTVLGLVPLGGLSPYSIAWSNLPAGCPSLNSTTLSCTPTAAGTFYPYATVSDRFGASNRSGGLILWVATPPRLTGLVATPAAVDVGEPLGLAGTVTPGSAPMTFTWSALPTGCTSTNASTLACTASAKGSWAVLLVVADTLGGMSSKGLNLTISPDLLPSVTLPNGNLSTLGTPLALWGGATGGSPGTDLYSWSVNGTGVVQGPSSNSTLDFLPNHGGTYTIVLTVNDSNGWPASAPAVQVSVASPVVVSLYPGYAAALDVGQGTSVAAAASGGSGVLTWTWWDNRAPVLGCASATCAYAPTATGAHHVWASVTDAYGRRGVSPQANITLASDPYVQTTPALGSTVLLGSSLSVNATVTGGVPGYAYSWRLGGAPVQQGPSGSYTFTPTSTGNFLLWVAVNDSVGVVVVSVHLNLTVQPAPGLAVAVVLAVGPNGGTVSIAGTPYAANGSVTLQAGSYAIVATARSGFHFVGWAVSGGLAVGSSSQASTTLSVASAGTLTATFAPTSGSTPGPSPGSVGQAVASPWVLLAIALVIAILVLYLVVSRKRRSGAAGVATPPSATTSVPAGGAAAPAPSGAGPSTTPSTPAAPAAPAPAVEIVPQWPFQPLTVLETVDETSVWKVVGSSGLPREGLLCFTREAPSLLTGVYGLQGATIYRLSRVESEDSIPPGNLEKIGDLIERHLAKGSGRAVVLPGLEALVEATSVKSVGRLLEVSRDLAQQSRGACLASFDPKTLPDTQAALLRRGATRLVIGPST